MRLHIYVGNIRGDADETIEGNKWAKTISLILYLEVNNPSYYCKQPLPLLRSLK